MFAATVNGRTFANWLVFAGWAVLVLGWIVAVVAFLVIGTEQCAKAALPLGGSIEICQDTTANAVVLLTVVGFAATVGSVFLWALRYIILAMQAIEENTRPRDR